MAKYCTRCGKKLKEGETCDCQNNKNVLDEESVNKLKELFKGIILKPIDTIKEFTNKDNFNLAIILILILSSMTSIFIMSIYKNGMTLLQASYGMIQTNEIPYLRIFISSILSVFVLSFLYTGLLYLVNNSIFKRESDFKKIYTMNAACSIITTIGTFAATILTFVNVNLGIIVFALSSILNMVYSYHGLEFLGKKEENKYGYIYLLTNIFFYISIFIISKLFS